MDRRGRSGLDLQVGLTSVPEGVDINDFPIIDISLEPNDGVETHSGDSKYRGIVDA